VDLVTQSIRLTNENNSIKRQIGGAVENKYYFPQWRLVWDELPKLKVHPWHTIVVERTETFRHGDVSTSSVTKQKQFAIDFYGREYWRQHGIEQSDLVKRLHEKGINIPAHQVKVILSKFYKWNDLSRVTERFVYNSGLRIYRLEVGIGCYYFLAPM